jgi:hypothetical protein
MQAETLTAEFGNAGILEVENTEKIAWRASLGSYSRKLVTG